MYPLTTTTQVHWDLDAFPYVDNPDGLPFNDTGADSSDRQTADAGATDSGGDA